MTLNELWFICNNWVYDTETIIFNEHCETIFEGVYGEITADMWSREVIGFTVNDEKMYIDMEVE